MSYRIDATIWRTSIAGYHLTNIAIHALSTWAVTRIGFLILGSHLLGGVAGVLFAIHPLSANAVAWLSARTSLMVSLFVLLSLLCYLEYRARGRQRLFVLSLGFFSAALLSKEQAFAFPLILMAVALSKNLIRVSGLAPHFVEARGRARDATFFFVVAAVVLGQTFRSGQAAGSVGFVTGNEANALTFADRFATGVFTVFTAVGALDGSVRDWLVSVGAQLLPMVLLALVCSAVVWRHAFRRLRDAKCVAAILWFGLGIAPSLLLFPTALELANLYFAVPVVALTGTVALQAIARKSRAIALIAASTLALLWITTALHVQRGWIAMGRFNGALHALLRETNKDRLLVVINAPDPFRIASDAEMAEILLTFRIAQSARRLGGWSAEKVDFVHRELVQLVAVESGANCRYDSEILDADKIRIVPVADSLEHRRECLSALRFMHFAGVTSGATPELLASRVPFRRDPRMLTDGTAVFWFDGMSLQPSSSPTRMSMY
jgi:hypothetical protein